MSRHVLLYVAAISLLCRQIDSHGPRVHGESDGPFDKFYPPPGDRHRPDGPKELSGEPHDSQPSHHGQVPSPPLHHDERDDRDEQPPPDTAPFDRHHEPEKRPFGPGVISGAGHHRSAAAAAEPWTREEKRPFGGGVFAKGGGGGAAGRGWSWRRMRRTRRELHEPESHSQHGRREDEEAWMDREQFGREDERDYKEDHRSDDRPHEGEDGPPPHPRRDEDGEPGEHRERDRDEAKELEKAEQEEELDEWERKLERRPPPLIEELEELEMSGRHRGSKFRRPPPSKEDDRRRKFLAAMLRLSRLQRERERDDERRRQQRRRVDEH